MTVKFTTNEAGVNNADVGTGTVAGSGDAFFAVTVATATCRYSIGAALYGTMGIEIITTATGGTGYVVHDIGAGVATLYNEYSWAPSALPASTMTVQLFRSSASANQLSVQITSAGKVSLLDSAGVSIPGVSTAYTLPTDGTKVRITGKITPNTTTAASGTILVEFFHGSSTSAVFSFSSSSVNLTTSLARYSRMGIVGSSGINGYSFKFDNQYTNDTGVNPGPQNSPPTLTLAGYDSNHVVRATAVNGSNTITSLSISPTASASWGTVFDKTFVLPSVAFGDSGVTYTVTASDGTLTDSEDITVSAEAAPTVVNIGAPKVNPAGLAVPNSTWE